ncbi:hypothetical protein [Gardnerella vaginalis]|uniref:Peptidase n=1 Tax=Gardnerella vaginalis TaxID=2702 RepID=A0A2K1STI5_GARVA|nr:hypothetical protein [Gardnerella vaginalis]PNS42847.1 hypothetical protein BFS05_05970 [Gardnerella vaginalis]
MLNKKAIAALAAGATLVSGLAFATPSFAAETPKKPTAEECKNAQDDVNAKKAALQDAKDDLVTANAAKRRAHKKLDAAKAAVTAYKNAVQKFVDAKNAIADVDAADLVAVATAQQKANNAAKDIKTAIDAAQNTGVKLETGAPTAPADYNGTAPDKKAYDTKLGTIKTDAEDTNAQNAQDAVSAAQDKLDLAEIHFKNLGCKASGNEQNPPANPPANPQNPVTLPTVVADPTTKDEAINATRLAAMVLQNAENDLAKKNHDYNDVKAAYEKVIRELSAAKANLEKAQHDLDAFLASGVDDSAKETRLTDLRDRAQAHVTRLAAEFTALTLKYNDAKTAAVAAGAAFKAAKAQYKKIYNEAIALGVNPALLPVVATSDPLMPNFADPAGAKELYAEAVSGKFGDAVAAAAKKGQKEAKKGEAKKGAAAPAGAKLDTKAAAAASAAPLSKTGVTVMFTALAASMLAGIGAAVRKFRH